MNSNIIELRMDGPIVNGKKVNVPFLIHQLIYPASCVDAIRKANKKNTHDYKRTGFEFGVDFRFRPNLRLLNRKPKILIHHASQEFSASLSGQ